MATNWPPSNYPSWPPPEYNVNRLEFSDVLSGIDMLTRDGFITALPTASERNQFFRGVLCDEGHQTNGIMLVSPSGVRYPFAYCVGATHKSALVLWVVGYSGIGEPVYDLGWGSGNGLG